LKSIQACVAAAAVAVAFAPCASVRAETPDPIGDLMGAVAARVGPFLDTFGLKATLYHLGARGIGGRDSLGCKVVPMRTAAVDGVDVKRHSVLFIKETVGLPMPDGRPHDGYWYATDIGGAIHRGRIDLFTGSGAASMIPMIPLNLATVTVTRVGEFSGCPTTGATGAIAVSSPDHRGDVAAFDGDHRPGGAPHQGGEDEGLSHIFGRHLLSQ
jgi:3D (Asp-Asp-Asp) domain-containing protein